MAQPRDRVGAGHAGVDTVRASFGNDLRHRRVALVGLGDHHRRRVNSVARA